LRLEDAEHQPPLRQLLVGELRLMRRDGRAFDGRVRRLLRRHGRHGGRVNGLMRRDGRAFDGRVKVSLRRHGRHGGRANGLMRRDGRVVLIANPLRQRA